jgi:cytochrome c
MKPYRWLLLLSALRLSLASTCMMAAAPASPEKPGTGKQLFERRCTGCHSLDQDKEGPRLRTVYGRKAGSVPTFAYSDALRSAQWTWDDAALDRWLKSTNSVAPGNNMEFRVVSAEERAAIIGFLKSAAQR